MREIGRKEFVVNGTWEEFSSRANHYGKARQGPDFVFYLSGADTGPILVHRVKSSDGFTQIDFTYAVDARGEMTITATLYSDEAKAYFDGLVKWLGKKRKERPGEGAKQQAPNAWLIEQHLDRARPLRELRAEWLQRRAAVGLRALEDVPSSMRDVISREKRRRAKETVSS